MTKSMNFKQSSGIWKSRWGYLVYDAPLTEKQISDYELRAAPSNPDRKGPMREQVQNKADIKSIAARLAKGAQQAAKENAARPISDKTTDKDR